MYELLHAGFDTLDVAIAGALPADTLKILEQARDEAAERQEPVLATIGNVDMHVSGHGMRGGYAFMTDTGPLGANWMIKHNTNKREWNIFASPRATTLLAYGYQGTKDILWKELSNMGGHATDHSVNRVDFAMDFRTKAFELHHDQFVAHSHTKVTPHWGKHGTSDRNQPAAVVRGRRLESVTVGKQPGRQVIVYDKLREAIERRKHFWFDTWGLDRHDPGAEVWRVEVRAGKKELKEKYALRRFSDIEAGIGDVMVNALLEVRYLDDQQNDSNVSRQQLHPLWTHAQETISRDLFAFRSGLTPGQVQEITRDDAIRRYATMLHASTLGLGIALGQDESMTAERLSAIAGRWVESEIHADQQRHEKAVTRMRKRLHFV